MVAFNLVQDGVDPGSGRARLVLLHHFMSGIPFVGQGEVNSLEEILLHGQQAL